MGSLSVLSPKVILSALTDNVDVSILTELMEFKLILWFDDNNIESVLELNNNLPEFNIR